MWVEAQSIDDIPTEAGPLEDDTQLAELTIIQQSSRRTEETVRVLLAANHHSSISIAFWF